MLLVELWIGGRREGCGWIGGESRKGVGWGCSGKREGERVKIKCGGGEKGCMKVFKSEREDGSETESDEESIGERKREREREKEKE